MPVSGSGRYHGLQKIFINVGQNLNTSVESLRLGIRWVYQKDNNFKYIVSLIKLIRNL